MLYTSVFHVSIKNANLIQSQYIFYKDLNNRTMKKYQKMAGAFDDFKKIVLKYITNLCQSCNT